MIHRPSRRTPEPLASRLLLGLGALLAATLILGPSVPAQAAPGDKLVGKWKAQAMEMGGKRHPVKAPQKIVFEFQKGGKFVVESSDGSNTSRVQGTWKATASKVTMTIRGKTETAKYVVSRKKLRLHKKPGGRKAIYHMQRI